MKSLVSVITPTYNRSGLLKEAIESVIAQTYRPIECIVVDDGSTDDTKQTVESLNLYNDNDFTIKYIYQTNSGSQVARNTGTKASIGEFIQYLDSDDLLYPEKIEKQVAFFKENPECSGVFGDWEKGALEKKEFILAYQSDDMLTQLLTDRIIVNFSFLMRRKLIYKIGEWDLSIKRNQEIDFQVRGLMEGAKYRYQSQTCGLWRIHTGDRIASTTGSKEILRFFQKWEVILLKKGLMKEKMKINIAHIYYCAVIQRIKKFDRSDLMLLIESVRLNPNIPFIHSKKMRLIRKLFGLKICLKLWALRAKLN